MMNRTELDARLLNHTARITYADRFGSLYDQPRVSRRDQRRFGATLLSCRSLRSAFALVRPAATNDAASA
jgi:hypothetical protein